MNKTTKRRTRIEIETHDITVIRTNDTRPTVFCGNCGAEVAEIAYERPALICGNSLERNSQAAAAENR